MHPDAIRTALTPVVAEAGCSIYDVEVAGTGKARTVQVLVDRTGGIDLEAVAAVTRSISDALDAIDPVGGSYTLEVGSPGLERPLRRPEHFLAAAGETVSVKFRDHAGAVQRVGGVLTNATTEHCVVDADGVEHEIAYDGVIAAHTAFVWSAEEKPGGPKSQKQSKSKHTKSSSKARATST